MKNPLIPPQITFKHHTELNEIIQKGQRNK